MLHKRPIIFHPFFSWSKTVLSRQIHTRQILSSCRAKWIDSNQVCCRKINVIPLSFFLLSVTIFWLSHDTIAAPERVVLTTGYNYSPYTGEQLPEGGMVTEIITTVLENMGLEPEYRRLPWKRALREAEEGRWLGTFPWEPRTELKKSFLYSDPIIVFDTKTYVDVNATQIPDSPKSLEGKKLCLPLGHRTYGLIGDMVEAGTLLTTSPGSMVQCFKQLKSGRVDLVSVSSMVARQYTKQVYGYVDGVQSLKIAATRTTFHLIISKRYPGGKKLMNFFNAELERMQALNALAPIVERHLWVR